MVEPASEETQPTEPVSVEALPDIKSFDINRMNETIDLLAEQGAELNSEKFADLLEELVALLSLFGKAMSYAFAGRLSERAATFARCASKRRCS